jgi:cold shock protein
MTQIFFTGTVKFFDLRKGFGFIFVDGGGDVFMHAKELAFAPKVGQRVAFTMTDDRRGARAADVRPLDDSVMRELRAARPRAGFGLG